MDALQQKKLNEAKAHIADAEKSMKTSLFKRKPDLDSAANEYTAAATCFKVAKDIKKAIEYFKKAAECYLQNNSSYNSAKQWEQISLLANEDKDYPLLMEAIEKAADLMVTSGTRDSAGIMLERGAKMLQINDPERSLVLYKKAIHISDVEDKHHEMVKFYESAIGLTVKLNKPNDAIELITQSFDVLDKVGSGEQIVKYILSAVIILLNRDDWVAAKNYAEKLKPRYDGAGFTNIDKLLEAYDEKDDETFKHLIKNYLSYAVDNEILKLANKIVKSEEWIKGQQEHELRPNVSHQQAPAPAPAPAPKAPAPAVSYEDEPEEEDQASETAAFPQPVKDAAPAAPTTQDDEDDEFANGFL